MPKHVLLIEDDESIAGLIKLHLEEAGHKIQIINNGNRAIQGFSEHNFSLVIVDLMLPGMGGQEIIQRIRAINRSVPILITSAKNDLIHKVVGFEIGADDYLSKPFEIAELVARAKALLRRASAINVPEEDQVEIEIGNIRIDQYRHKVFIRDKEISLPPKLFELLLFLIKRPGRAYSRSELLVHVWNYEHEGYEHTVDTHINRLRSKIEPKPSSPQYILTVWGLGYRFAEPSELKLKNR